MAENEVNIDEEGKYRHKRSDLVEALGLDEEVAIRATSEVMALMQMKFPPSKIIEWLENKFEGHTLYFAIYTYGVLVESSRIKYLPPQLMFRV